jgi:Zn finger protein HypA/HybF involved in hydrogenase expression
MSKNGKKGWVVGNIMCPNCKSFFSVERNMRPKCYRCGSNLKIVKKQNGFHIFLRNRKNK